ncbi:MAG: NAD(P)-dependent oxidoreductase [Bacteroidetes bacterium]|jgi:CDP-paratose synthetase|nr:NAD(P)-dependent oxidoreductase [Bacteroidota bacterium]
MKTILITGINGFLGSNLAERLNSNFEIIGLENSLENLFRLKDTFYKVYSSQYGKLEEVFKENRIDIIIHTATVYGRNTEGLQQIIETNFNFPSRLLDIAIKNKVSLFMNTDSALDRFVSPYALTKSQFREWLVFRKDEIKVMNLQLEHFYGPGCSSTNFITSMINRLIINESRIDLTSGEQKRDFIYYEDIIDAFEMLINNREEIKESYKQFELGTGVQHSVKKVLLIMKKLTGSSSDLNFGAIPFRTNEMMVSKTDISDLINLGWKPKYTIEEGLEKTIKKLFR